MLITSALVDRWFAATTQPTYATHLSRQLSQAEITKVHTTFNRLVNQTVKWESAIALIHACRKTN
jgi:hypothetical protein